MEADLSVALALSPTFAGGARFGAARDAVGWFCAILAASRKLVGFLGTTGSGALTTTTAAAAGFVTAAGAVDVDGATSAVFSST